MGGSKILEENDKYSFYLAIMPSNPNIHFVRLTINEPSAADGGNYIVRAVNAVGEKDCTLALNFGGGAETEDNVPARVYEQPLLLQPDPNTLILEGHIHANPKPKVTWLQRRLCERVREEDVEAGADGGGEQVESQ